MILNLYESEPIWFRTYLIPNLSFSGPILFQPIWFWWCLDITSTYVSTTYYNSHYSLEIYNQNKKVYIHTTLWPSYTKVTTEFSLGGVSDNAEFWLSDVNETAKFWLNSVNDSDSTTESIKFWTYFIPRLSDSRTICFWTYLIPNLSYSKPIWFQTYLILNLSNAEPFFFWTYPFLTYLILKVPWHDLCPRFDYFYNPNITT
jgi:hypothetical protein